MKKTLLFFLLLFTTIFYAQVSNIEHCGGDTSFNLTSQKTLLIGNLDPAQTTVSYHLSLTDAQNNLNAIASPTNYVVAASTLTAASSKTIYARINNNGTVTTNYFNVIVSPIFIFSSGVKPITCSNEKATVYITGLGGKQPIQFSSDNITFNDTSTITDVVPGTYTFFVKDALGCVASGDVTVNPYLPLSITDHAKKDVNCIGRDNGEITANFQGGTAPYTYSLLNSTGTVLKSYKNSYLNTGFGGLKPGTYGIRITDEHSCSTEITQIEIVQPTSIIISATSTPAACTSNTGTITASATGGIPPYTYSITNGGYEAKNVFTNLSPGIYTVYTKDANECLTYTSNVEVKSVGSGPNITATGTNAMCYGSKDGSITVSVTGGQAPYQYSINNNTYIASNVFTNLYSGTYSIKVKDANGCISELIYTITNPLPITASFTVEGQTITINSPQGGVAPYKYSLDGIHYVTSNVFTGLTAGAYTVKVKDAQGCEITMIATIPPGLTTAILKNLDCNGAATITVTGIGGQSPYTYSINGGPYQASNVFNNLTEGSYFVTVKDAVNSVSVTNTITIAPYIPLTAAVTNTPITNCSINYDSTITITASGGQAPYQYSANSINNFQASNMFFGAAPGTHIVNVKDANGCLFTTSLVIESPASLVVNAIVTQAAVCGGKDSVTMNATGGQSPYTYSFTGGNTFSAVNTNELSPGGYTLFVKDNNGCIASTYITITFSTLPVSTLLTVTNTTTTNSNDGSITMSASGGTAPYTYSLLNSNNVVLVPEQTSSIFNNLAPGTYGVIVKDAKGCSSMLMRVTIAAPAVLTSIATVTPVSCINEKGSITVKAIGGIAPYEYSFNSQPYTSNNVFNNLYPGVYHIDTRDTSGYVTSLSVTISPLTPLTVNVYHTDANCYGDNSGSIAINAAGGSGLYTYSLSKNGMIIIPNSINTIFSNLSAGSYTVTTTDANSACIMSVEVYITEPAMLFATLVVDDQKITVHTTGGNGSYDYSLDWLGYQTNNIFTNVSYGIHQVLVRDQNGCALAINVSIDPPAPLIDGKNTTTIEFTAGQTLGDLVVQGQNIKWYSTSSLAGKTNKSADASLPLSTILVDGTTYYASQTINGIESPERLAVTAKVKGSLSTPDFVLPNFAYYPNPVEHTLSISNTSNIDEVEIISVSGKSILAKKINNTQSEIDLSNVSSGFYFLKVKSEGQVKTIKIVKK
ncbi:T9SS type A sorting domain-containing protein [Flavobacterium sp. N1736]|uniref:T9SS type A sorting domain-containing protein n=1 Tax=Flavobacterium sp. N1736 TaxID=2986823 RepID=UPI0022253D49|nr:T9SS type A sorting domain-containing protein [Flavobacterium sp. N1736]